MAWIVPLVLALALRPASATELDAQKIPSWKLYKPATNNLLGIKPAAPKTNAPPASAAFSTPGSKPVAAAKGDIDWAQAWCEGFPPGMAPPTGGAWGGSAVKGGKYKVATKTKALPQLDPAKARETAIPGIASRYLDDLGLDKDPDVVVFADFDDGQIHYELADDWSGTRWGAVSKISKVEPVSGSYCLANTWAGDDTGGTASRWFLEKLTGRGRPMYFMRLYHKFDENWFGEGKVLGMKGFGFVGYAQKCGATVPCDGKNWFTSEMQWVGWGPSAKPNIYKGLCIQGHYYSYSTALEGVQPTMNDELKINTNEGGGAPYRFSAYTPPYSWLQLGEWYCFEVGILPNTPGQSDGEGCLWINGRLETRVTGLRYYDLENAFKLYATIQQYRTQTDNTKAAEVSRYVDNLVVARRYIGPIRFSPERLQYLRDHGIVVHVDNPDDVTAMRRTRTKLQPKR